VTTRQNTLGDSSQIELNAFGPDVDENDLKASVDASAGITGQKSESTLKSCS
jgi:hypothetical protein